MWKVPKKTVVGLATARNTSYSSSVGFETEMCRSRGCFRSGNEYNRGYDVGIVYVCLLLFVFVDRSFSRWFIRDSDAKCKTCHSSYLLFSLEDGCDHAKYEFQMCLSEYFA